MNLSEHFEAFLQEIEGPGKCATCSTQIEEKIFRTFKFLYCKNCKIEVDEFGASLYKPATPSKFKAGDRIRFTEKSFIFQGFTGVIKGKGRDKRYAVELNESGLHTEADDIELEEIDLNFPVGAKVEIVRALYGAAGIQSGTQATVESEDKTDNTRLWIKLLTNNGLILVKKDEVRLVK